MPLVIVEGQKPGQPMRFRCEGCGGMGRFSVRANIRAALDALATGNSREAIAKAGLWFCGRIDDEPTCVAHPAPPPQASLF